MPSKWTQTIENDRIAQRLYAATKPSDVTPSRTHTNATTSGYYTGNNMGGAREGDDQHKNYTGAGFQAQIKRI